MFNISRLRLDAGLHAPRIWSLNVPPRLKELLWKDITGSLPIRTTWSSRMDLGRLCCCSSPMTLVHIWSRCRTHDLTPLFTVLQMRLLGLFDKHAKSSSGQTTRWNHPWYPLLVLKELESKVLVRKKNHKILKSQARMDDWLISLVSVD